MSTTCGQGHASTTGSIDASFAHGTETVKLEVTHTGWETYRQLAEDGIFEYSWDKVIQVLGPFMIDEAPEPKLRSTLESHMLRDLFENEPEGWALNWSRDAIEISDASWGSIIVQLRALGMITTGMKKRAVSDKAVYWKLTPAGDDYLVKLRAVPSASTH